MPDGPPSLGAIIVAAGSSQRMGGVDKLWLDLDGQPLLARTIEAIAAAPGLAQLVVVSGAGTLTRAQALAATYPWSAVACWVAGGATRQDSVWEGLQALQSCDLVLIHDGARPLIDAETISRGLGVAREHGSAIAALPVTDTIKVVDAEGRVLQTPDRSTLWAAQTPQIFAWPLIRAAYARVGRARAGCTDDAGILELAGFPVYMYLGTRTNIKVSTPADVAVLGALWAMSREGART